MIDIEHRVNDYIRNGGDLPVFQELRTVQQEEQHYAELQRQRYDAAEPAGVFDDDDEEWDEPRFRLHNRSLLLIPILSQIRHPETTNASPSAK